MTQIARVYSVEDDGALVEVLRQSACGGDCKSCGGCGHESRLMRVKVKNIVGAAVGDRVVIESSTKKVIKMASVVYILPLLLMVAFYFLPSGDEGVRIVCSFGGLAAGAGICALYSKTIGNKDDFSAEIIRIFNN